MNMRGSVLIMALLAGDATYADSKPDEIDESHFKTLSGMSVLGNNEAPKSLVIVPWKSSELGTGLQVSRVLDDGKGPVDKDEFMRQLSYYEIRSEGQQQE